MYKCHNVDMSFTQSDIKILDEMFDKKLKPIKRAITALRKDLNWTMLKYDTRLTHLESHIIHPPGRAAN